MNLLTSVNKRSDLWKTMLFHCGVECNPSENSVSDSGQVPQTAYGLIASLKNL